MQKSTLFLPFIGLIAFTIGGVFLMFQPALISLSPGDSLPISFAGIFAAIFSIVTIIILLISVFRNKK